MQLPYNSSGDSVGLRYHDTFLHGSALLVCWSNLAVFVHGCLRIDLLLVRSLFRVGRGGGVVWLFIFFVFSLVWFVCLFDLC